MDQITKFFDEHSPLVLAISTTALAIITAYYAIQNRFLTKNQLRPVFYPSLISSKQNTVRPFDVLLLLTNLGIGPAFKIHVQYSIKGIKNSKQKGIIRYIEHNWKDSIKLTQNDQPLRYDGTTNRVLQFKLKYEGISGRYVAKFQLTENDFF
jgi:hypothetical protein